MVTGSRDWDDYDTIREALQTVKEADVTLIHGDQRGADRIAADIADQELGWKTLPYPADWKKGRKAGPLRNQAMVDSKPDVVFAFPLGSSIGTPDAVRRARAAGIRVVFPAVPEPSHVPREE